MKKRRTSGTATLETQQVRHLWCSMAQRWSPEDDQKLLELRGQTPPATFGEIASEFGRGIAACRSRYWMLTQKGEQHDPFPEEIGDRDDDSASVLEQWRLANDKPTWREILDYAQKGKELQERVRPVYTRAKRTIKTKGGVFLVHMSDFHLGSPACDYEQFFATTDLLLSDPRFYLVIVGPDLESAFAWFYSAEAVLSQVIPPYMQLEAYRLWLDKMLPRTVAVCGDNHQDQRLEKVLGDIGLVWREDVPYFRTYGILEIELDAGNGKPITYEEVLAHKYRGSSTYHDLQPALRMMRDIYPLADVYCTAHTHSPAYMSGVFFPEARPLKPTQHFVVTGTFKTGDDLYAMRNFGRQDNYVYFLAADRRLAADRPPGNRPGRSPAAA